MKNVRYIVFTCIVSVTAGLGSAILLHNEQDDEDGRTTNPEGIALFLHMREYGNPGINVFDKLWQTYESLESQNRLALDKASVLNQWTNIGPVNIAGRIRALAIHPAKPDIVFAGSASGGVWRSRDFGMAWESLTDDFPALAVGAISIDINNPDRIIVGTGEPVASSTNTHGNATPIYNGVGVFQSEDGGDTWTKLPWPGGTSSIHRIALHPASTDTFLVATLSDVWKTTNAGQDWTRVLNGVATDIYYHPSNPAVIYAALGRDYGSGNNGVWISEAGGERFTWRKLTNNFPRSDSLGRIALAVTPSMPNRVFAAVAKNRTLLANSEDPNDFLMLMISNDGGETWERKINAIPTNFTRNQSWYDLAIGVSPTNPSLVLLGGVDVWRSTNGGNSFVKVSDWNLRTTNPNSPQYVHADQHAFFFKPDNPNTVLVGSDGGMHISTDGGANWQMRANTMVTVQYYTCAYDNNSPRRFYGGTQDQSNQRQLSAGDNRWMFISGGDGGPIAVDPTNAFTLYFTVNADVRRSTNGGSTSSALTEGLNGGPTSDNRNWKRPVALHPSDRTLLYTGSQYLYVLRNAPTATFPSWSIISPALTRTGASIIVDMDFAPTNTDWLYTVSGDGRASLCENIRSTDPQWMNISTGLPNRWLSDITVDWDDHQTAYIAVSGFGTGHAYKTTNAGQSWVNISGDFPDIPAGAIVRARHDVNTIYLATDFGVWYTTNGGTNWKPFGEGLPNVVVFDMKLTPENVLLAGTHGRGMWTASSILSTGTPAREILFTLGQNYPNAVRDMTTIPFTLGHRGRVRLSLFDPAGRLVRTVLDEFREAGAYAPTISLSDLRTGTYFYTLEANAQRQTRRLVVLR